MLDERTEALLEAINLSCKTGTYQVVEEGELLDYFPESFQVDKDGLAHMLSYLKEHGYVDVRFVESGVYCLCPLPHGRIYFEERQAQRRQENDFLKRVLFAVSLVSALSSFFGGLLAGLF